jgi:prepilin-type N-terminal cleavage/methylation domain-containing protein
MRQPSRSEMGFTLIELAVVISIIAVLDVAVGQTAKLNVVFVPAVQLPSVQPVAAGQGGNGSWHVPGQGSPGQGPGQGPAQCTVNLTMADSSGKVVAASTETLLPNQSKSISFDNAAVVNPLGNPPAAEYHALVAIPECPDNTTTCSRQERQLQTECLQLSGEFASSLESIDDASGKTVAILPGISTGSSTQLIGLQPGGSPHEDRD